MGKKNKLKTADKPNKKPKVDEFKPVKKLADQSFDEFVQGWDDDDDVSDVEMTQDVEDTKQSVHPEEKKLKKKKQKKAKSDEKPIEKDEKPIEKDENVDDKEQKKEDNVKEMKEKDDDSSDEEMGQSTGANKQKKYMNSLKQNDPEFYKFLKKEDKDLLDFDESSSDDEKDNEEQVHELPDSLEVASDESDYEFEDEVDDTGRREGTKVTKEMVDEWTTILDTNPTSKDINSVAQAFRAAVDSLGSAEKDEEEKPCIYWLEGSTMFNSVVRMCVCSMYTGIKGFLKQSNEQKPQKSKKWKKIDKPVRIYLNQICIMLSRISDSSVAVILLKHVHQMIPYFQMNVKGEKVLLNKTIKLWSEGQDTVRVLALLCIIKLARNSGDLQERAIKQMFTAYVANTKFTSPSTLPNINFMRRSLVEVYALDHNLAYFQAFIQIRQLAIHLRTAMTKSNKDTRQAVCNWQYVHSLELWGALLGHAGKSETLSPLIYPLTQVILGVLKLADGAKYIPMRFHCANVLSNLSSETGTFIPVLPIYLDILKSSIFNKKSRKVSMKPMELLCILKATKSQMIESGFKESVIEEVHAGVLTYLAHQSNKIGFPELVTPLLLQLKDFIKNCKVGNFSKKMKQILEKVKANKDFVEKRRRTVTFGVGERQKIDMWEALLERDGTPLLGFYRSWKKVAEDNMRRKMTQSISLGDTNYIPIIKKKTKRQDVEEEVTGFLSGSDDDMDDEERFKLKEERGKKNADKDADQDNEEEMDENESDDGDDDVDDQEELDDDDANDVSDEGSDGDGDEVKDLRLEDFGDSDLEMNDEFGDDKKDESEDDDDSD